MSPDAHLVQVALPHPIEEPLTYLWPGFLVLLLMFFLLSLLNVVILKKEGL